jgi:hypothetical protein
VFSIVTFFSHSFGSRKVAQQSLHWMLGILRKSKAVSYALAFFQLDGFAVLTPAQVKQTFRRLDGVKQ